MEIILLERVERLGQMGDVVTVKAGYARNFLLPGGKALRATKTNRERFEKQRGQLETQNLERRSEAEAVAARMDGQAIVLIRQAGENGQLYGSVTARDIGDGLTAAGFSVARRQVLIDHPIKELGLHAVQIMLHPEVSVTVKANVAQSEESAASQAASGGRREAAVAEDGQLADAAPPTEPAAPDAATSDKKDKAD